MSFRAASPVRMLVATLVPSEICYGRTRLLASTGPCAHPTMPHARWPDSELISKPVRSRSCSSAATGPAVGWDSHPRRSAGAELRREHAARLRVCRRHRCICCSTAVSRANLVRRWWRRSARGTGRSGIVRARCVWHAPPTPPQCAVRRWTLGFLWRARPLLDVSLGSSSLAVAVPCVDAGRHSAPALFPALGSVLAQLIARRMFRRPRGAALTLG